MAAQLQPGSSMRTADDFGVDGHRDMKTKMINADYSPSEHEREWVELSPPSPRCHYPCY
jgi:hypothetical protein